MTKSASKGKNTLIIQLRLLMRSCPKVPEQSAPPTVVCLRQPEESSTMIISFSLHNSCSNKMCQVILTKPCRLIEDWDFEDDNEGGWTINTEDNHYSFYLLNGMWQMTDKNGDTVDSFPPFSTLEEDDPEIADGYEINDDGADSPRVIGKVTGGTETTSEGGSSAEGNDTPDSQSSVSEGDSEHSGANPLAIIAGVAALAGVGGIGYYMTKKRK